MKTRTLRWIATLLLGLCLGLLIGVSARGQVEVSATNEHGAMLDLTKGKEIPPEVVAKLDKEQLYKLMTMKMEKSADIPLIVPLIVGIVFACPVAIVLIVLYYRQRRIRQLHQTLAVMIEKGVPIPQELLGREVRQRPSDLRRGIILIATGLGLLGFLLGQKDEAWGLALIPLLIGFGYLLVWKLDQHRPTS
jgi:hypothetical protein